VAGEYLQKKKWLDRCKIDREDSQLMMAGTLYGIIVNDGSTGYLTHGNHTNLLDDELWRFWRSKNEDKDLLSTTTVTTIQLRRFQICPCPPRDLGAL
jgi:hypothetical protein